MKSKTIDIIWMLWFEVSAVFAAVYAFVCFYAEWWIIGFIVCTYCAVAIMAVFTLAREL